MASCFTPAPSARRGPPLTARGFREKEELRIAFLQCSNSNKSDGDNKANGDPSTLIGANPLSCRKRPKNEASSNEDQDSLPFRQQKRCKNFPKSQSLPESRPATNDRQRQQQPVIHIQPREMDCVCDRGHGVNDRLGNLAFRWLVTKNVTRYQTVQEKAVKKKLLQQIVETFQHKWGRFLRQDKDTQQWYVLNDREARAKVGQQIRYQINSNGTKHQEKDKCLANKEEEQEDTSKDNIESTSSSRMPYPLWPSVSSSAPDDPEKEYGESDYGEFDD